MHRSRTRGVRTGGVGTELAAGLLLRQRDADTALAGRSGAARPDVGDGVAHGCDEEGDARRAAARRRVRDRRRGLNRAEVYGRRGNSNDYSTWADGENSERWYGWSTYFPDSFPAVPEWAIVLQWASMAGGNSPLVMAMRDGRLSLNYDPSHLQDGDTTPLWRSANTVTNNAWHTFVAHISWSWWPNLGFVEFWHNGVQVVPKTFMSTTRCCAVQGTAVNAYPTYLKMGIYRAPEIADTAVLYHGPMRIGISKAMVEPPVPGG